MEDNTCVFDGCTKKRYSRSDLCGGHYTQQRRGEPLRPIRRYRFWQTRDEHGRKLCRLCEQWLSPDNFRSNACRPDGLEYQCEPCFVDLGYRRRYGITLAQYSVMLREQDGSCLICDDVDIDRRLHVDHDHATGAVRGLLCGRCNVGLGCFRDDPKLLRLAATYLELNE